MKSLFKFLLRYLKNTVISELLKQDVELELAFDDGTAHARVYIQGVKTAEKSQTIIHTN